MKECKSGNCLSKATVATLAISAVTLIGGAILAACLYAKVDNMHKVLVESQFGSASNFEKVFEAKMTEEVKKQLDEQTEKMIQELQPQGEKTNDTKKLSSQEIEDILGYTPTLEDKKSELLIVEYADFLCGHCKSLHDQGTLESLSKEHENVAVAIKAIPLFGAQSQAGAYGAYCAAQLGGEKSYYAYINQAFDAQATSNEEAQANAKAIGLDAEKFANCLTDKATATAVEAAFPLAMEKFGVGGTPASIVINTKTGKYEVVGGAAPKSNFESALENVKA